MLPEPMTTLQDSADLTLDQPLHERVRDKLSTWEAIGTPAIILEWIREGVSFPLTAPVKPFFHTQITPTPEALAYWRDKLLPHYLASGAIEEMPAPTKDAAFVSKCFFVPKTSSGYRLVVDLREINTYFEDHKIKFENLSLLRFASSSVRVGGKVDLSDAYHHLSLHPNLRRYFCFKIDNKFYRCVGVPFGWKLAPYAYTKFTRPIITALRSPGLP